MQPNPRADTSRLLFPSLRFCIVAPIRRILSTLKVKNSVPGQKGLAYSAELLAKSSGEDGCKKNPHFCRNRAEMGPISTTRLLDSFGDGDDPAFGIFESKFAHPIELIFDRH